MSLADPTNRYYVGLELGPMGMPTALAVLKRPWVNLDTHPDRRRPAYTVPHLQRFAVGTPYPEIVIAVRTLLNTHPLPGSFLVVDQTGVGKAVADLVHDGLDNQVTCRWWRVAITTQLTPGVATIQQIPKQELVGTLLVLFQSRRLQIARELPDAATLVRELENYRYKPPPPDSTDPLAAWRDGPQDDLILAAALAAYWGELQLPGLYERPPDPPPRYVLW